MNRSDQQQFESMDKQIAIETISFSPSHHFKNQIPRNTRKSEDDIIWKFNSISNQDKIEQNRPKSNFNRNISFEEDEYLSAGDDVSQDDSNQIQQSEFITHYKGCEQVYRKKYSFGTSWIGRKQYYSSVFIDPARIQKNSLPYYTAGCAACEDEVIADKMCSFDSDFESGNLFNVFKIGEFQYDLLLQNDINTKGNTQWFYFRINNPPKKQNIKINIVNLRKSDSLFNYGMLPCIFSAEEQKRSKRGWFRGGKHIKYFKNDHAIQNSRKCYYTLTLTVSTPHQNDVLRIAQCYPYTVSDLNNFLDGIQKIKFKKQMMERQTILNTIGKNKVEVVTIKEPTSKIKNKPYLIIMARQHPGQSPGSFVCEGLIDFLFSKEKQSQYLRRNFQIKIIPMVNPDGVVAGNYRTNLYGFDLNRRWDGAKTKNLHQAAYIKKYISSLMKGREISFILDLHGHSRKLFSFFYGNPSSANPVDVRIFPLICSKLSPNCIRFQDSTFMSQDYKRNTARVQFSLCFKTLNVFTYQTSFFGYFGKDKEKKHFTPDCYRQLGMILGKSLYLHQRGKEIFPTTPDNKEIYIYKKCITELKNNINLILCGEKLNSGSESSPEECQVKENEEMRLEQSEDYLRINTSPAKSVKIVKKILKKDIPVKQIYKSTRQMQVLDIKQVNSIFPNNILALIPSSFLQAKKKVNITIASQTDNTPLMKIYQACKQQEYKTMYNPQIISPQTRSEIMSSKQIQKKQPSNLLRSNILSRPKSSAIDGDTIQQSGFSSMSQRKSRQSKRRQQSSIKKRVYSQGISKTQEKGVQTTLTFNTSNIVTNLKARLQKQISILEYKAIDPSYSTIQYHKGKLQLKSTGIGKALSRNMFQNIKLRKRNPI